MYCMFSKEAAYKPHSVCVCVCVYDLSVLQLFHSWRHFLAVLHSTFVAYYETRKVRMCAILLISSSNVTTFVSIVHHKWSFL